jgi:hypothetical protein
LVDLYLVCRFARGEAAVLVAGGDGGPGAQRVPVMALRVEPGIARRLFDQPGDRLVGGFFPW